MAKTVYLGIDDNGYFLEITGTDKDGVRYRKRTNSERRIASYLHNEGNYFLDARIKENDLIVYTKKEVRFVLKNYQVLDASLFDEFFNRLESTPVVSKNLKSGIRSTPLQMLGLRLLYVNKVKLASLALTGTILVTSAVGFTNSRENLHSKIEEDIVTENVIEVEPEIVITEEPVIEEESFASRLIQTQTLQEQYNGYDHSRIMLGARVNNTVSNVFETEEGKMIVETANKFGVDPYLLIAKGMTESSLDHNSCIPGGSRYNGYGVGAFQLESPDGRIVTAWNFENGSEESLAITMENACDFEKNVQGAAMYLQNRLNLYHGNIYLALQSYNYGQAMMKIIIHDYAKQMGISEEEVINNQNDLGWLDIVKDVHERPNSYYYRVILDLDENDPNVIAEAKKNCVWTSGKYGNDHYIADVLSYYVGIKSQNKDLNGTDIVTDLVSHNIMVLSENQNEMEGRVL